MSVTRRNSFRRGGTHSGPKSGFGRMLLLSLGLHLTVFLLFGTTGFFNRAQPPREVYHVDLLSLPAKKKSTPVVQPPATPKAVQPVVKQAAPKRKPRPKPKAKPKAVVKKTKAAAIKVPVTPARPSDRDLSDVAARITALKKQQAQDDMAAIKERLAKIKADLSAPVAPAVTTGSAGGGAELADKITLYLQDNWTFSPYQLRGDEVDARFLVKYNVGGEMIDFKRQVSSGNAIFDQSAKNAIIKSKKLPFPLDKAQAFEILFEVETIKKRR